MSPSLEGSHLLELNSRGLLFDSDTQHECEMGEEMNWNSSKPAHGNFTPYTNDFGIVEEFRPVPSIHQSEYTLDEMGAQGKALR
jgi:hypothetical protein